MTSVLSHTVYKRCRVCYILLESAKVLTCESEVWFYQNLYQGLCGRICLMNKKLKTEAVDRLFDGILCLNTREECCRFMEDLCTVNELLSLSQRFEVASMLKNGSTYLEIAEKTGASTATISRVNRSLNYGNEGYDIVLDRMKK